MPDYLVQLTSAFSGLQLIVIAFVLMELRSVREALKRNETLNDNRDKSITLLTSRVAHLSGRMKMEEDD